METTATTTPQRVTCWLYGPGTVVRSYKIRGRDAYLVRFDNWCLVDVYASSVAVIA